MDAGKLFKRNVRIRLTDDGFVETTTWFGLARRSRAWQTIEREAPAAGELERVRVRREDDPDPTQQ
jgi:hypothetical protein